MKKKIICDWSMKNAKDIFGETQIVTDACIWRKVIWLNNRSHGKIRRSPAKSKNTEHCYFLFGTVVTLKHMRKEQLIVKNPGFRRYMKEILKIIEKR
jgi:hypothetical protein